MLTAIVSEKNNEKGLLCRIQPQAVSVQTSARGEITLSPAKVSDLKRVEEVCNQAWKGIWEGDSQMFLDRVAAFPEGGIVVARINGEIHGYISCQLTDCQTLLQLTWEEATDNGHFTRTHNPNGEWIHGAGLAVTPEGSRAGITGKLVQYITDYTFANNKRGARFITRMPGYYKYAKEMSAEEYVSLTRNGRPIDPELRILSRYGFLPVSPPLVYTDYVQGGGDPSSCGKSVLIERLNPLWK